MKNSFNALIMLEIMRRRIIYKLFASLPIENAVARGCIT